MPVHAWALVLAVATLLAGCSQGPQFPRHDDLQRAEPPNLHGLVVEGHLSGGGSEVRIAAEARNEGPITYMVSSVCVPPWTEGMKGHLGTVYPKGPKGYCHALGLREFRPGERIPYDLAWNGTLWDFQRERFVAAEPGTYEWDWAFEVYAQCVGGSCQVHDWVKLHFTVTVE